MNEDHEYIEYLECVCTHPGCILRIVIERDEYPKDPKFLVEVQLNPFIPWYKRLYWALYYSVFSNAPIWSGTYLSEQSVSKLSKSITSYRMIKKLRESRRLRNK